MAYEVTATRRRPKIFDELAGQDFVVATLKNSLEQGHIAHAYLFSGPRGCGKTSAARILARSLNCEQGPTVTPCGVCPTCQEISRGASLDIIEIDGASNTGVNDVRQIKDEVLFPPNSGRYKVYIIDEVHMLSNSAFNALLKTIEEPPPYIVFIFATTELHKVPATIKSRCQQFAFRLIPIEMIASILKATCTEMHIQAEDEALFWIAKESTGSLRDAYTLFDQVAAFSDGYIRSALIREKLGLVGLDNLNALAEACVEHDSTQAFTLIDDMLNAGVAIEQFISDLAGYYHSILFIQAGITRESLLDYSPDRFSPKVLEGLNKLQLEHALDLLLTLYRDIRYSIAPRFELETVVSKLCWLGQWISPLELRAAIVEAQAALGLSGSSGVEGAGGNSAAARMELPGVLHDSSIPSPAPAQQKPLQEPNRRLSSSQAGSLSENFDRLVVAKASGVPPPDFAKPVSPVHNGAEQPGSVPETGRQAPRIAGSIEGDPVAGSDHQNGSPDSPRLAPQVERVLHVFRGTVVKET
ncbi:MAG: DNA polymerase III subunit gamma/tau [Treponema sp.]|jgi:DNA polymerase-3 subunit gamma/tau|nr:DNA polymerase III subunit gamma/tau [Treponema sp.]